MELSSSTRCSCFLDIVNIIEAEASRHGLLSVDTRSLFKSNSDFLVLDNSNDLRYPEVSNINPNAKISSFNPMHYNSATLTFVLSDSRSKTGSFKCKIRIFGARSNSDYFRIHAQLMGNNNKDMPFVENGTTELLSGDEQYTLFKKIVLYPGVDVIFSTNGFLKYKEDTFRDFIRNMFNLITSSKIKDVLANFN